MICLSGYSIMSKSHFPVDFQLQDVDAMFGRFSTAFLCFPPAFFDHISPSAEISHACRGVRRRVNSEERLARICCSLMNKLTDNG
jgi:hypothetical protein